MAFTPDLISWYEANKRTLPFRGIRNPYLIWVSEVILQQTRMEQGLGYYRRFVERFPDIPSLASAGEEEVLKLWEGLGYYSRARNLLASAREIAGRMDGQFPGNYNEIRKLKGIGEYTAASIASLAFDEPRAAVDGNVYRFMARHFGFREPAGSATGRKRAEAKAEELMDRRQPGTFNQAMIEFGALVCTPADPGCSTCIFSGSCYAYKQGVTGKFPVKRRTERVRKRYFNYLVITRETPGDLRIVLNKRTGNDIWKNLYDFPLIETTRRYSPERLLKSRAWSDLFREMHPVVTGVSDEFRHLLSHQVILARFYRICLPDPPAGGLEEYRLEEITGIPLPRLINLYLEKFFD